MTENAQFWFNQELIPPPPMACAGHKTRQPFALNTGFPVNTLLEKMYHTMSAKVTKHNLQEYEEKRQHPPLEASVQQKIRGKNWGFFIFTNLSLLLNFANHIFTVYTEKQHLLGAE